MRLTSILVLLLTVPALAAPVVEKRPADKNHPGYSIDIYPAPVPASNPAARARAERQAARRVQADVSDFKHAYADAPPGELPWEFDEGYKLVYKDARFATLRFVGTDFRGGPHGTPLLSALTYDRDTGREIPVSHFFRPGSHYLEVLSRYTRAELLRRAKKTSMLEPLSSTITTGTAPKADNFQVLYPGRKALVVIFPAYQVASYAEGPQTVEIPYSSLRSIVDPHGPLR